MRRMVVGSGGITLVVVVSRDGGGGCGVIRCDIIMFQYVFDATDYT